MTEPRKVLARRPPTQHSHVRSARGQAGRVAEDLLTEEVQRLAVFAAVAFGLWTFGLVMDLVVLRAVPSSFVPSPVVTIIELLGMATAVLTFLYMRYWSHSPETKSHAGIAFLLINAAGVALMNARMYLPDEVPAMHVSWNAVVILVFSMIAPTSPARMAVACVAAATMDPLAAAIARLMGAPAPSFLAALVLYLPNYACAAVAVLPSRVFQRLGRRLREAQDVGSYTLVELLGHGGMGEVWRAEHRLLARSAAVKLVRPEVLGAATGEDARLILKRFEREAQATSALSSPHTIQVYDFGMSLDGAFYYVMELLFGSDLESLVREFGPVPADRALFLLRQVCHSLADAHARGLVHRDIKPANVYVCRMGLEYDFVKVLDFGLVKVGQPTGERTLATIVNHTTGTPAYMAPEIILGESDVDQRADVYALGCVAYYLLTGQLVFEADTSMKMLLQHVQAQPEPPSARTELNIPPDLDELILACLEKDPAKRPQNAQELFKLACDCKTCETWNQNAAKSWWEKHLPELTGPLTVTDTAPSGAVVGTRQ
jgi:serine/threonine-protein kinase